jgi:hypothetical protein
LQSEKQNAMSKQKKILKTTSTDSQPALEPTKSRSTEDKSVQGVTSDLLFGRNNYMWILAGVGLMALGFALMGGGSMPSPDVWDPEIIYSFRRTVLAPVVILAGLGFQFVAIFAKK